MVILCNLPRNTHPHQALLPFLLQWSYQFWCFLSNFYGFLQQLSPHGPSFFSTVAFCRRVRCAGAFRWAKAWIPSCCAESSKPRRNSSVGWRWRRLRSRREAGGRGMFFLVEHRGTFFRNLKLYKTIRCYWWSHPEVGGWGETKTSGTPTSTMPEVRLLSEGSTFFSWIIPAGFG